MPSLAVNSDFNVAATINDDFTSWVNAYTLPTWFGAFSSPSVRHDDTTFEANSLPLFSTMHIMVGGDFAYMGNVGVTNASTRDTNLIEIDGWLSRQDGNNAVWLAQKRVMGDIAKQWAKQHSSIVVKDYSVNAGAPTTTNAIVRLQEVRSTEPAHDPNPDIERVRLLIPYWWDYRGQ